jgi:hypothetical protein
LFLEKKHHKDQDDQLMTYAHHKEGHMQQFVTAINYDFWTATDNPELSVAVLEPLLIIDINNGSYSKIKYSLV